ncbi:hypothetical protein SDC9_112293 [bioreactor metagenome]|uniref:Uncharacterized protein n=1 Tax=bioreactor metagenome TaxID=1076179 RepID=A0A645BJ64_9ZZZZ
MPAKRHHPRHKIRRRQKISAIQVCRLPVQCNLLIWGKARLHCFFAQRYKLFGIYFACQAVVPAVRTGRKQNHVARTGHPGFFKQITDAVYPVFQGAHRVAGAVLPHRVDQFFLRDDLVAKRDKVLQQVTNLVGARAVANYRVIDHNLKFTQHLNVNT